MDKRIADYIEEIVEEEQSLIYYKYDGLVALKCREQTPIEILMFLALFHEKEMTFGDLEKLHIKPQEQINKYRVDFLVTEQMESLDGEIESASVIVECDGHKFHEKTKEQAESDKKRERALQTLGYPILRFSGREIWRNPTDCAQQVVNFLTKQIHRQQGACK